MSLDVEAILRAQDRTVRKVACPEWGGEVALRTLTAAERDTWEMAMSEGNKNVRASLVALAMCDEKGQALAPTEAQITALGTKAAGPMDRLFDAVLEMNSMRKTDVEAAAKNLPTTPEPDSK